MSLLVLFRGGSPPPPTVCIAALANASGAVKYMRKNVAGQNIEGQMLARTDGSPLTTSVSVFVTIDNGTQTAGGGTTTHKGNGQWNYAPTQAETNGNHVAFLFTHATGVNQVVNVYPVAYNPYDAASLGLTNLDAAISSRMATYTQPAGFLAATFPAGTVAGAADQTAIKTKTDQLTFTKANELDANVQSVNGVTIIGDGSATPFNV